MLARKKRITFQEFMEIDTNSEERLEFIDGEIISQATPSTAHQRIAGKLFRKFGDYFDGKSCEPFISPFDVIFEYKEEHHKVQPDLLVICDKAGLNEKNYLGTPSLIVEILSPTTASVDYVKKMNLYMTFGVKEYWIVSPKNNEIQVFLLENDVYSEPQTYKAAGLLKSSTFEGFHINIEDIFS